MLERWLRSQWTRPCAQIRQPGGADKTPGDGPRGRCRDQVQPYRCNLLKWSERRHPARRVQGWGNKVTRKTEDRKTARRAQRDCVLHGQFAERAGPAVTALPADHDTECAAGELALGCRALPLREVRNTHAHVDWLITPSVQPCGSALTAIRSELCCGGPKPLSRCVKLLLMWVCAPGMGTDQQGAPLGACHGRCRGLDARLPGGAP